MSSSDDDSDSSYDAPNLRLFGVRGSRKNAAPQPEPEPEPEPVQAAPAEPQTRSPAATASPVHSAPQPVSASSSSSSPAASRELLELTQKVQALEAMNNSPLPALPAATPPPAKDAPSVGVATPPSASSLEVRLEAARTATSQLQLELSAKEAEMQREREQHETNSRKALKILTSKDEELEAKDAQLRSLAAVSERDSALVSELRESVARLNDAVRDKEEQLEAAREENGALRTQSASVGSDADKQLGMIRDLEQRLQESKSMNASLEAAVAQASEQRSAADAQAAGVYGQQRQQLLDQMAADKQIYQAALSEKDERISQLEAQLAEAEQTIQTLHTHGKDLSAPPSDISPTTHDKRLTAMTELLSMDVDEEDHVTAHLPQVDVQPDPSLPTDLKKTLEREASLKAELDEAVEAQSKLQGLVHRMGAERDGLYAEIDEARAAAIQLEDTLNTERESWGREKADLEHQLSQRLEELKAAARSAQQKSESNSDRERSPRFQELTNLAADDAVFQMQVKELEDELQSAHTQLAARRDEVKKLQTQLEKLESSAAREVPRKNKRRADAGQAATEKAKELGRCKQQLRAAAEENTRLNERIQKLEKLQEMAKSSALKAEKELESLRAAANDATRRHQSDIASRSRHQEQLERRLEAAETAHEQTRSELVAKEAELRELRSLGDLSPTSAADRLERFDSASAKLQAISASDFHIDWHSKEEAYRTEVSSLKHEVHQVRMKLRHTLASKSTREQELDDTIKRLGRRSKLHESVQELSTQLSLSQSEANRMRIEVESLQLEKDHVKGELHRKTDRIEQLERQMASYSQDDEREQSARRIESLMQENRQLDELLKAAQQEFEERGEQDKERDFQLQELNSVKQQLKDKQAQVLTQQLTEESNQEAIVALERNCSDLRTQLSEAQRRLCVSQQEAATRSTEDASRHAKEVCASEQRAREQELEVESLRKKMSAVSDEARQLKAALQAAEETVSKHKADCEEQLANAAEETNRIRREACQCVSENERLHSIVEEKTKQIGLLQESFDVLRDGRDESIEQQVVLLAAHLDDSSSSHCELQRRLAEMQGALQGQVIDFTALQREAASMFSKLGALSADLSTSQQLLRDREDEMSQFRLDFASTQRELECTQREVEFLSQKSNAAEEQLAKMQAEHVKQEQENSAKAAATAAEHDRSIQGLKLQILELQHEADNQLPLSTGGADGKASELLSELKHISNQVRECCTGIAESEPGGKENWCSRVDAALDAYEGAILNQSKQLGASLGKNQELLTETLCASHTIKAQQAQLQELSSKLQVAARKTDTLQVQLDGMKSQDIAARNRLADTLQQKMEALVAELAEAKRTSHVHASTSESLQRDVETLSQQLAQSQRALAVASTAKSNHEANPTGDVEERVSRLRAFFEAEVARLVGIPDDSERLQEMSQQLAASKIMEDDLRMKVFSLEQQKDVLLTDAVVLKDVIRALEADLSQVQTTSHKPDSTSVPPARILELQSTIAEHRTDAEVERQRAAQLSTRVEHLEQKLQQAEAENVASKQELSLKLQQTQEDMQKAQQEELASLQKDYFEQKTKQAEEIFALQSELKQLKLSEPRNRSSLETSISESVTTTALTAAQLDMDLESTRKQLSQLAAENSKLVEQLADSRAEISSNTAIISELESALNLVDQHSKKQGKSSKKKKDWNSSGAADSVAAMSRKYATAQANLANAKRQLRAHEKRERSLQQQIRERDVRVEELTAQHEKTKLAAEAAEADLSELSSRDSDAKQVIDNDGLSEHTKEQELRILLEQSEASSKENANRVKVLTTAVEQLTTQLHESTQGAGSAAIRGRGARKSSGYGVAHTEKGGRSKSKLAAIEISQRFVIEKLQSDNETLRTELRALEHDQTSAKRSAEAFESCFGYMQTVALSAAGIAPLLEIITPKDSVELTETESIIRNVSSEFGNIRQVCDAFAETSMSPMKTRPTVGTSIPTADVDARTSDTDSRLAAGVHRELHRTLWDVVNYSGRTLYGHLINSLPQFFHAIDKASSGTISRAELRAACVRLDIGLSPLQLDQLVATIDEDRDGGISMDEFARWMESSGWVHKDDVPAAGTNATTPPHSRSESNTSAATTPNRSGLGGAKRKVAEMDTQLTELTAAYEKAKRQLQEGNVRYDNLTTNHRQVLRKLEGAEKLQAELLETAKDREAIVSELKTSKHQLLRRVEQLQAALVQVEQASTTEPEQPDLEEEQQETIRELKSELSQQKVDAEAAAEKLRMESAHAAEELRNAVEAAESEVTRLQGQAQEAAAAAAQMSTEEREQMSQQLHGVQHAMELKEEEMETAVERIASMQKAYVELQAELQAAEEAAQSEMEVGASEAEGLRAQLEGSKAECSSLRTKLANAEEQLEGARAECGSLRKLLEQKSKQKQKPKQKQNQKHKSRDMLEQRQDQQDSAADGNDGAAATSDQDAEVQNLAKSVEILQVQKAELQQLLEDAESARGEQAAQRVAVESELRKAGAKAEKWKTRQKNTDRKLKESRAECAGLREQVRGASARLAQAKKEGEKAVRAKGKQGQSELEALRTENLRKAGVIEELRGADGTHVREKQELLARAESAEAKSKSLTKELARRVDSVTEVRAQNAAAKALADQRTAEQEKLEQKMKDLVASNGRKDVSIRTLKLRIEELQAEISALRSGHSEAAEALVAEAEAAKKEAAKVAKSDLARKEERIQLLLAKVSELSAALNRKERSGGAAASTARELRWLRGAVKRTLSQLASENSKLQLRLPLRAGASGMHGSTERLADQNYGGGEVAALSTSVMSDLLDDMSGSDADSVVIGGYRSDGDIAMMMSSNGMSTASAPAANANPHQAVLMRRSANELLAPKPSGNDSDKDEGEVVRGGADRASQSAKNGGRKGKAPRVGELKKWLASLVDDTGGGMGEKLAAATIAMNAAGQQGHGGLETLVSLLITERLSLERAVVAASKARSAAAATTPPSQIESATVAGAGSGASVDMDKQLELMTKRYESQIHAIRTQVLQEQQSADRTIAELRRRLGE